MGTSTSFLKEKNKTLVFYVLKYIFPQSLKCLRPWLLK